MHFDHDSVMERFKSARRADKYLVGVSCLQGLTAIHAVNGGADMILALNSGYYRTAGISAMAGMGPYANCNRMIMQVATREILPRLRNTPVFFGLCGTDPTIEIDHFLDEIKAQNFAGINNYPTVGLFGDGFQRALEMDGISYRQEVEAIYLARKKDLFTIAFVFNEEQTKMMIDAGADIICAHFGVTRGGLVGARKALSLEECIHRANQIFVVCENRRTEALRMVYGGPVTSPIDVQYINDNTLNCDGYLGGSTFERIPSGEAIMQIVSRFKAVGDKRLSITDEATDRYDYVGFVKEYVANNYMNSISLEDIAKMVHVSRSHLSTLFKRDVGCSFPEYVARHRIQLAIKIKQENPGFYWSNVAQMTGFCDYAHFSHVFKKQMMTSPGEYEKIKGNEQT